MKQPCGIDSVVSGHGVGVMVGVEGVGVTLLVGAGVGGGGAPGHIDTDITAGLGGFGVMPGPLTQVPVPEMKLPNSSYEPPQPPLLPQLISIAVATNPSSGKRNSQLRPNVIANSASPDGGCASGVRDNQEVGELFSSNEIAEFDPAWPFSSS